MTPVDIVIPVYNEGDGIVPVLEAFRRHVGTPHRLFICYDSEDDPTLAAIAAWPHRNETDIRLVRNPGRGVHAAILAGFRATTAPAVFCWMADDTFNMELVAPMIARFEDGCDIVTGSRFMKGGCMVGRRWDKLLLTILANFTLYRFARMPTHDSTNGIRLFSRRLIDAVAVESSKGFTFTLEMMVKAHRLGLRIEEIPARWYERTTGKSNFKVLPWIAPYLRWYFYAFATTWLGRGPETVKLNPGARRPAPAPG
jgi:glycosyltransferase involved in cell wall biosynthesis